MSKNRQAYHCSTLPVATLPGYSSVTVQYFRVVVIDLLILFSSGFSGFKFRLLPTDYRSGWMVDRRGRLVTG